MMGWLKDYTGSFTTGLLAMGGILFITTLLAWSLRLVIKVE
jgi:MFS transporter, ACS family, tartrate transporter